MDHDPDYVATFLGLRDEHVIYVIEPSPLHFLHGLQLKHFK